ncbi:hypothetical protein Gotur_009834, partial [Gossypium turneri]
MTMASSNIPILVDDGFNEYESALKCQKFTTSKVWDEMTKLECENKNDVKAQCITILLKPFLAILDSCLTGMLRNRNPRLPLWLGVLMF